MASLLLPGSAVQYIVVIVVGKRDAILCCAEFLLLADFLPVGQEEYRGLLVGGGSIVITANKGMWYVYSTTPSRPSVTARPAEPSLTPFGNHETLRFFFPVMKNFLFSAVLAGAFVNLPVNPVKTEIKRTDRKFQFETGIQYFNVCVGYVTLNL